MKFATVPKRQYHLTLVMLQHYPGKFKIQIFCRYSTDMEKIRTNCTFIAYNLVMHPQILLIANEIVHVTVLLFVYFCDQFVAPDIRRSSVNNQHGIERRGQNFD